MKPTHTPFRASIFTRITGVLLWPIGMLYGLLMRCRRGAYRRGWLPRRRVSVPVICVGNLTVGGTGKTPMVAWLVKYLRSTGKHPAILTRGYKARGGQSDEAALLTKLTDAPVVVNPDRVVGAQQAIAEGADVLVMDDGFQHLRLRRDFNIVLIDAMNPFGRGARAGAYLPAGRMRESLSALTDADAILFTRTDHVPSQTMADLWSRVSERAPKALLATAVHLPQVVIDENHQPHPPDVLAGKKVFLFSGLGHPEGFHRTVEALKANVVGVRRFGDHACYTEKTIRDVLAEAKRLGADILLTTQKDGVKLPPAPADPPIQQLAVDLDIPDGRLELIEAIDEVVRK
ncbi:MAG: tetraacyldisaccharide 4'-kinase [Phycisphaerae bacterium]|nr:tetraacyldisaccharide 4'-kinase [Phycisphaerae bacterium]